MSLKKAQKIARELEDEHGFVLDAYQCSDLEAIRDGITAFLKQGVDTEDLAIDEDEDDYDN